MRINTKKLLVPVLLLLCLVLSAGSYAQAMKQPALKLKLGNADISGKSTVTTDQVLADPQLLFSDPSYVVVSFTLSFQPHDKDFIGLMLRRCKAYREGDRHLPSAESRWRKQNKGIF